MNNLPELEEIVLPNSVTAPTYDGGLAGVVVRHIEDDIEDRRTLRGWRKFLAGALMLVSALFYGTFFFLLFKVVFNIESYQSLLEASAVTVAVVVALVSVPTLLLLIVAKAVFGMSKSSGEVQYSPIQSIIHLMKEMSGAGPT